MVTALILSVVFTSGVSLTFRNRPADAIDSKNLMAYLTTITIGGLATAILSSVLLYFFSQRSIEIPPSIYIIGFIYSFFACVNLGFQDALVAKGNLKLATFLDFVTILVQGLSLIFFSFLAQTSLFMSVVISFVISYLLTVFATISIFVQTEKFEFKGVGTEIKLLLFSSRQNQLFGIANGITDRMDRFLIGLMLPLTFLAKYALITSLISYTRFFPEAYNRVLLLKHHQKNPKQKTDLGLFAYSITGIAVLAFVFFSQGFIRIAFGENWLLPSNVALLFALQEILRGWYQSNATKLVALGESRAVSQISLLLIVGAIVMMLVGINIVGLVGAPISMIFLYLFLNQMIRSKLKDLS
jgi:O-antigen/teichoic acid export membrane protein